MKKRVRMLAAMICYCLGVLGAFYVGGWVMLLQPIQMLLDAYTCRTLTLPLVAVSIIKIIFSSTFAGLVWCVGYIGCNHFKGTEDPDWNEIGKEKKE